MNTTPLLTDKKLRIAVHGLPFAFAIHNVEEAFGMEQWSHTVPPYVHVPVTTVQFAFAVTIFTLLGFFLVFRQRLYPSPAIYVRFVTAFAGMLFLNVFFPHAIATLYFQSYAPGIVSALLLNLPLAAFILIRTVSIGLIPLRTAAGFSLLGGLVGAALAFVLLRLGMFITGS